MLLARQLYVSKIKSTTKKQPQWLVNSRIKAISSIYSYFLSFGAGMKMLKTLLFPYFES